MLHNSNNNTDTSLSYLLLTNQIIKILKNENIKIALRSKKTIYMTLFSKLKYKILKPLQSYVVYTKECRCSKNIFDNNNNHND